MFCAASKHDFRHVQQVALEVEELSRSLYVHSFAMMRVPDLSHA